MAVIFPVLLVQRFAEETLCRHCRSIWRQRLTGAEHAASEIDGPGGVFAQSREFR
jgi:hypothetical protein